MFRNATNIVLALLLLSTTMGLFLSKHNCDLRFVGISINSEVKGCCATHAQSTEGYVTDINNTCNYQHIGHYDCESHNERDCSCSHEMRLFTSGDVLIIKKSIIHAISQVDMLVSYQREDIIALLFNNRVANILFNHSLPKAPHDLQVEYGVFLC